MYFVLRLSLVLFAISSAWGASQNFSDTSDVFQKLKAVNYELQDWLISHREQVKDGKTTFQVAERNFWLLNRDYREFLLEQALDTVTTILRRLEVEMDLLLSDPESVEDLMQLDVQQIIDFLHGHPVYLRILLREPMFKAFRDNLKLYYVNAHSLPQSVRFQELVHVKKWNAT